MRKHKRLRMLCLLTAVLLLCVCLPLTSYADPYHGNEHEPPSQITPCAPNGNVNGGDRDDRKPETTGKPTSEPTSKPTNTTKPTCTTKPTETTRPTCTTKPTNTTKPTCTAKPTNTTKPTCTTTPTCIPSEEPESSNVPTPIPSLDPTPSPSQETICSPDCTESPAATVQPDDDTSPKTGADEASLPALMLVALAAAASFVCCLRKRAR